VVRDRQALNMLSVFVIDEVSPSTTSCSS
jgi:hypothetical protein